MNEIHALTQKCVTPEQWEKMLADNPDLAEVKPIDRSNSKCISHQH